MRRFFAAIKLLLIVFIITGILFMLYLLSLGFINIAQSLSGSHLNMKFIITGVEYFFVSPLPLIIILAIFNYFNTVVKNSVLQSQDATIYRKKYSSLAIEELSVAKYFFTSILVSILFVSLLEIIQELRLRLNEANHTNITNLFLSDYLYITITVIMLIVLLLFYIRLINIHKNSGNQNKSEKLYVDGDDISEKIAQRKKNI